MSEDKKGHVKITVEIELNEEMMSVVKEAIAKMPSMMPGRMRENM
jgi:hypothetical protein